MRPKIRCDGRCTVLLQNFLDLNWAKVALFGSSYLAVLTEFNMVFGPGM
jgi:hypothetical protein